MYMMGNTILAWLIMTSREEGMYFVRLSHKCKAKLTVLPKGRLVDVSGWFRRYVFGRAKKVLSTLDIIHVMKSI